ncbi:hypothetical protein KDW99_11050 [Marinomonas rhizomae]|uniref:hypothetical protein n=1 Tax=Marinomonas rhizomae TaxID=491948 RepID=UPI002105379F|nr:hypothetical protein [Marinomonas rhizomae]UTV97838.1 hypothetical protein KDW99_11050 [Marinomonas rhizomae]
MLKETRIVTVLSALLIGSQTMAADNNLTLKYEVLKGTNHLVDITIKVNDTYLRTDYQLLNERHTKLTEMTVKWKGQYVIDHNKHSAYLFDYNVVHERAEKAFSEMAAKIPNLSAEQIFEMSIDPANDESKFVRYEDVGNNKLIGKIDGDLEYEIQYLEVPNKYIKKEQYDWLLSRAKEDQKFGRGFVSILDQPLSELMRRLSYQFSVFPVFIKTYDYNITLKSVDSDFIDENDLKIEQGIIQKDVTYSGIQFLESLSDRMDQ